MSCLPPLSRAVVLRPAVLYPAVLKIAVLCLAFLGLAGCSIVKESPQTTSKVGPKRSSAATDAALVGLDFSTGRLQVVIPHGGDWRTELEAGRQELARKDKAVALAHFAAAVASAPDRLETYLPLADLLRRLRRPAAAEATLRTALDLDRDDPRIWTRLASLLASLQRRSEAVDAYGEALALEPTSGDVHGRLAAELYYLGELERAAESLDAARRHGGHIPGALPALLARAGSASPAPSLPPLATSAPAVRVDAGGVAQAVETAIAGAGPGLVAAWNDQRDGESTGVWRLGAAVSADGGATWSEGLVRPPGAVAGDFEGDPMSAYDPRTGNLWVGGVSFYQGGKLYLARKRPANASFDAPVVVSSDPSLFYDKPLMAAGPAPGDPSSTRLYIAYSEGLQVSTDLGATWGPRVVLAPLFDEVIYQPRVGPDGALSIVSWDTQDGIWIRRSTDGGATVGARQRIATRMDVWGLQDSSRVPGTYRAPSLPTLAVGPDATLYVAYSDTSEVVNGNSNLDLYLITSSDGGATWSTPAVINSDASPHGDQFAPWLEAGADGTLHLVFYDTRYTPQDDTDPTGLVDVTYASSSDGGASWHETRVTDVSSSSADAVWMGGEGVPDYQFLGDYLGLTVTSEGAVVLYGAASGGDFDIFARRITNDTVFADDFESGSTAAWSVVTGN